jgi:nitrite reductase (NADH) large subunit
MTKRTLVVIGNGMVGHRFIERMCEHDRKGEWQLVCFGEEFRPAYDRVHLSEFFAGRSAADLQLADPDWYRDHGVALHLGEQVLEIDRTNQVVIADSRRAQPYDALVLATGSAPFVPSLPGVDLPGVFVYRTIDDLERIQSWARRATRAAVIGGGLLGLEAAKALVDLGLDTHVVEFSPRLMPRQVDAAGGEVLRRAIEGVGVGVHLGRQTEAIAGDEVVRALRFKNADPLAVDMVVISAGIRPRDELARAAGLAIGERGGVIIDPTLTTSDPRIYAIGESASLAGTVYGLVAPGYEMADVLARRRCGGGETFAGADMSTKLKLLGVDVASLGDAFADETAGSNAQRVVFEDRVRGVYQKLVLSADGTHLLGAILVGDAAPYASLMLAVREGRPVPERPHELLFGSGGGTAGGVGDLADDSQVCSCNNVTKGALCAAIAAQELTTVGAVKTCTKAGTGCGGCLPLVTKLLDQALADAGQTITRHLCEHFPHTRQELFQIVKINRIETFDALLARYGHGGGCEVCRPAVASILASTWNDFILTQPTIQDTNDRFLANIQRGGTYSVIPRIPGGEITPQQLIVLGDIAKRYDLYCKITGGQRIDLLGARVDQLPEIWEELVAAGFESGHAYGKALRTGIRAPHKLKSAVSGCIRECAEAQSKDFGIIATEKGWNLYVGGNGGSQPRHAELLVSDVDADRLVQITDRFLMYYLHTANPLERTARWLERLDGGVDYLRRVVVDDVLGVCSQLEADMQHLVDSYECEWAAVVRDPARRAAFRHFANDDAPDPDLRWVRERGQRRPADWSNSAHAAPVAVDRTAASWVQVAQVADVPPDGGITIRHGTTQIAVFHFATRGEWYATQASCPHRQENLLGRGLLGTQGDVPKVACPLHKRTFDLSTGAGLSDPSLRVHTFPVEVRGQSVWVHLPPAETLATAIPCGAGVAAGEAL